MSISVQDLKAHVGPTLAASLDAQSFDWQAFLQAKTALLLGLATGATPVQMQADLRAALPPEHVKALDAAGFDWRALVALLLQLFGGLLKPAAQTP